MYSKKFWILSVFQIEYLESQIVVSLSVPEYQTLVWFEESKPESELHRLIEQQEDGHVYLLFLAVRTRFLMCLLRSLSMLLRKQYFR